jgi:hypothetical protein
LIIRTRVRGGGSEAGIPYRLRNLTGRKRRTADQIPWSTSWANHLAGAGVDAKRLRHAAVNPTFENSAAETNPRSRPNASQRPTSLEMSLWRWIVTDDA